MLNNIKVYKDIPKYLQETKKELIKIVEINEIPLQHYLTDFVSNEGKMLRPILYYLFRSLSNKELEELDIKLSASIEMLHMATLIHDDIIDDSIIRRGQVTIQSKFGKDVAVYAGDYLITIFMELLFKSHLDIELIEYNVNVMKNLLKGELSQKAHRYIQNNALSYYKVVYCKTGSLFGLACYQGAKQAKLNDQKCKLAEKIGYHLGVIFQIYDDLLDYHISSSSNLGKPVFQDINNGIYTLPIILIQEDAKEELNNILFKKQKLSIKDQEKILSIIRKYRGIEKTKIVIDKYEQLIFKELEMFENADLIEAFRCIINKLKEKEADYGQ